MSLIKSILNSASKKEKIVLSKLSTPILAIKLNPGSSPKILFLHPNRIDLTSMHISKELRKTKISIMKISSSKKINQPKPRTPKITPRKMESAKSSVKPLVSKILSTMSLDNILCCMRQNHHKNSSKNLVGIFQKAIWKWLNKIVGKYANDEQ